MILAKKNLKIPKG